MSEQSSDLQKKLRKAMDRVHELVKEVYVDRWKPRDEVIRAALAELDAIRKKVDRVNQEYR